MHKLSSKSKPKVKARGRTNIPNPDASATRPNTASEMRTKGTRPQGPGPGTHRGDRRDTHPSFSTGKVHRDGGRAGPLGASGRKNGPATDPKNGGGRR
jgi:hypothetical protein